MGKLFRVDGYWKDTKAPIYNELIYEYDEHPIWLHDDEIFFYGMNEDNIINAINEGENNELEFVIENYEEMNRLEYQYLIIGDIVELINLNPNDFELGMEIRKYINNLYE